MTRINFQMSAVLTSITLLSPLLIVLDTLTLSHGAPIESTSNSLSWNGRYFQKLIFTAKDINRTLLYRKEQVTPELVDKIRHSDDDPSPTITSSSAASVASSPLNSPDSNNVTLNIVVTEDSHKDKTRTVV